MAFSAFILKRGVCSNDIAFNSTVPKCPLLTFDLFLLHLLSTADLALLLVILSTALSPSYYISHSPSLLDRDGLAKNPESTDAFIMWDLALASPPSSPRLDATPSSSTKTYGTATPATPLTPAAHPQPSNPYADGESPSGDSLPPPRKDKFAEGRLWNYASLCSCSMGAIITTALSLWRANATVLVIENGKYRVFHFLSSSCPLTRNESLGKYRHARHSVPKFLVCLHLVS